LIGTFTKKGEFMRAIICFILPVLIGCSFVNNQAGFKFYDAHSECYHSSTAGLNAKKEFGLEREPKIVVVATSSKDNPKYKEQMKTIYNVNAEEMQYMYIIANSKEEGRSGYYTSTSTSIKLLAGDIFKVLIYDEKGDLIAQSNEVFSESRLKYHLTRKSSGR
jgi:hypothetical protein